MSLNPFADFLINCEVWSIDYFLLKILHNFDMTTDIIMFVFSLNNGTIRLLCEIDCMIPVFMASMCC